MRHIARHRGFDQRFCNVKTRRRASRGGEKDTSSSLQDNLALDQEIFTGNKDNFALIKETAAVDQEQRAINKDNRPVSQDNSRHAKEHFH